MSNLANLLSGGRKDWAAGTPPLSDIEIEAAKRRIGRRLPPTLLELYRLCDGGEGSLPRDPYNFVLWGIQEVAETREHEHYREFYDRYVFFGGNGGGEYFGIDEAGRIFFMDPIAGEDSIEVYCATFDEFIAEVGLSPPEEEQGRELSPSLNPVGVRPHGQLFPRAENNIRGLAEPLSGQAIMPTDDDALYNSLDDENEVWVLRGGSIPVPVIGPLRMVLELAYECSASGRSTGSIAKAGDDETIIDHQQMSRLWDRLGLRRPSAK
jgi:hypothetical protein